MAAWLLVIFLFLLLSGLPIGFAMATTALIIIYMYDIVSITSVSNMMYSALNTYTLVALPFFILVGSFLSGGRVVGYIYDFANSFLGKIKGGLGVAVIITSGVLAAISGSSMANAAALSMVLLPVLVKHSYPRGNAAALIATGGTLGILIPPSITMIVFGVVTNQSIGKLFISGVIPGIILMIFLMIAAVILAPKGTKSTENFSLMRCWATFKKAFAIILAPVIILGGIYLGWFTPEEAAAVATIYCIIIAGFWYKTLTIKQIFTIFRDGSYTSARIMFLVSAAMIFAYVVTLSQIPQLMIETIGNSGVSLFWVVVMVNLVLIVLGCFLDVFSIMLITLPVVYPILTKLGYDPFQMAVMYTINMEIGTITPPVGMNLYAIAGTSDVPIDEIVRHSWPYYIVLLIGLALVSSIPWLSNWLPSLMSMD